jgi:hypothetical protein
MRLIRISLITGLLLSCSVNARAQCKPGDPVGYFEGTVKSQEAGELKVSLNLRCANHQFQGEMSTPVGEFSIKGGNFDSGRLGLQFDAGGDVGTIEAQIDGPTLQGSFHLGNDSGPVNLRRVGDPKPPKAKEPTLNLTPEQWREDLKFFATELPKRHANAFQYVSRERFEAEVAALYHNIDHLNADEIYAGMDRIANMIGDGHTFIRLPPDDATFPLLLRQFGDETRVAAVTGGNENALGARVLKVQDVPISRAREVLKAFTPSAETEILANARIDGFLTNGMLLHGIGIISNRNTAHYTLADDKGTEFTLEVRALLPADASRREWLPAYKDQRPLFRQKPEDDFWYVYLPDVRTIYCSFRGYQNLAEKSRGLFDLINQKQPDKLVIDLRLNGGGDFAKGLKYIIDPIKSIPNINRKGHLFVLIGPSTFSAAMSNSAHFRFQTNAMLVGQTIGERPNSYQESRELPLPNSHLVLRYSTQLYRFVEKGENLIRPDKEIIPTWDDYRSGRDPVLDWILKQ